MNLATLVVVAYGLFCIIGGIIGYVKAKSRASFIAGSVAGMVLLVSAFGITQDHFVARVAVGVTAFLLGIRFLRTWLKTRRLVPDLLMIVFSLVTLIVLVSS